MNDPYLRFRRKTNPTTATNAAPAYMSIVCVLIPPGTATEVTAGATSIIFGADFGDEVRFETALFASCARAGLLDRKEFKLEPIEPKSIYYLFPLFMRNITTIKRTPRKAAPMMIIVLFDLGAS